MLEGLAVLRTERPLEGLPAVTPLLASLPEGGIRLSRGATHRGGQRGGEQHPRRKWPEEEREPATTFSFAAPLAVL